ncbi:ATP phosphoribosyltransferase regulatory subunit [Alkalilacustris brevis]|uniref:ATP phosphoribosyltransferase regulatory subunit n=1 Tax=Alkalilacustris brevis TaxID=2026338 RepID=UPI000E0D0EC5|nr:ATP phosphoribosyltransferase regulatory subunit [Alkalilacustris brevis]
MLAAAPDKATIRLKAARLLAHFQSRGAQVVEADILQPAETLLDLYGEDIRARAYVTADPLRGEMMLRPDFTVPVVQMHMAHGAEPARYAYMGEVFRRQEHLGPRASEYMQVGYELFDRGDAAAADAEVFAAIAEVLAPLGLRAVIGDIGLLRAAVAGLSTTAPRRAALMRHIWRPGRFRALLERFSGQSPACEARAAMLRRFEAARPEALIAEAGPLIGKRSAEEITARVAALRADAQEPPIPADEVALLARLLDLKGPVAVVLPDLRDLAGQIPAIAPAVAGLEARLDALAALGHPAEALEFEASYGRTQMEYYDGFVFGFLAGQGDLPPVATGGRYDALTAVLGAGAAIPAVGGVIRPGVVARLKAEGGAA